MNLIDTYVSEVGRRLPRKGRADIEAELRSVLQDMLEERSKKAGKAIDEELTLQILREYGAPDKVAASYLPERYLIGPRLFPIFLRVLAIVFPIITVLALVGGFAASFSAQDIVGSIASALAGFFGTAISVLGNLVLIFAFIEWAMRQGGTGTQAAKQKEWDPRSLRKVSPPDRSGVGERVSEIVFNLAAIVVFNFYPHAIGFTSSLNQAFATGDWSSVTFTPIFTDLFFSRFVPWLTLIWAIEILISVLVMRAGAWKAVTRLGNVVIRVATIVVAAAMLATPAVLNLTPETIRAGGLMDLGTAELLASMASIGFASVVTIVMIVEAVEIGKHLYRLIRSAF
jgi:hypothetical protein